MKKLIAMLLCIAMVVALGVQAFAVELTNREKAEEAAAKKAVVVNKKAAYVNYADMLVEVEKVYVDYEKAYGELKKDSNATAADFVILDKEYQAKLTAIKNSDKAAAAIISGWAGTAPTFLGTTLTTFSTTDPFTLNTSHDGVYKAWDVQIAEMNKRANDVFDATIAAHQADEDLYNKMADKEEAAAAEAAAKAAAEAAAAEAAAKLEAAAIKAAKAAVSDPKNSAEWMKYWAAYDKVYADKELKDAKKAAEDAKKSVKTAQEAAYAQAKNAVEWAQAKAYDTMEQEITKAVNDYIAGVGAALTEFYAELYA